MDTSEPVNRSSPQSNTKYLRLHHNIYLHIEGGHLVGRKRQLAIDLNRFIERTCAFRGRGVGLSNIAFVNVNLIGHARVGSFGGFTQIEDVVTTNCYAKLLDCVE